MKEREESSSIFVVGERIYNVKFNMNAQTWLLIHYWLFLLEYFFPPRGGLGPKGCVGHTLMVAKETLWLKQIVQLEQMNKFYFNLLDKETYILENICKKCCNFSLNAVF